MSSEKEKTVFDAHAKTFETLGFWDQLYKSSVIAAIEDRYNTETIRNCKIADIDKNGDEFLIKWVKRFRPLTDEELEEQYGRKIPKDKVVNTLRTKCSTPCRYSKAMNQPSPRLCEVCKHPEPHGV